MSALVSYEPLVNDTVDVFIQKTKEYYVDSGSSCDMSQWLQYFAFDVIGGLTWSERLGFIERNGDVDGIIAFLSGFMTYAGIIGQMPFLDLLWKKNPIRLQLQRWGLDKRIFPVTKFALDRSIERAAEMKTIQQTGVTDEKDGRAVDLLSKFQIAKHDHPDFMTDDQVLAACTSMVIAGSETTAISLGSVFYHLLKHPRVHKKLMAELDENAANGIIADRDNHRVSWVESQKLPCLDAVIQESFRMHPAAGMILERVTPPQGITICGEYIPGGVIVGCNAWVLHRRTEVFGADVDIFRPERWLDASTEQLREMKAAMFQFGAGPRTCIGKNISLLEIYKLVPTLLRNFEVELDCDEWEIDNSFFVRQKGFRVRFKLRTVPASA